MRLDKNTVAALGLPEGVSDKIHFDSELSGFGYRVRRSAGGELLRSYIAQYRSGGASKRLLIGDAAKITCAQARELAKKALADVVRGEDPSAVKADRRTKDELRFSTLAARYIEARSRKLRHWRLFRCASRHANRHHQARQRRCLFDGDHERRGAPADAHDRDDILRMVHDRGADRKQPGDRHGAA
jgi:hypothetical protein